MSWNYYDDYYYISAEHAKALRKNEALVNQLAKKRQHMCGVGTRKLKLFLNKLIKEGDTVAEIFRTALEIEDENIVAKQNRYYADKHYAKKEELIGKLVDLCLKENVLFGIQNVDGRETNHIMYFELPHCQQISFHCTLDQNTIEKCPLYEKEWDKQVNTTLPKLERAINEIYGETIKERYCKPAKS